MTDVLEQWEADSYQMLRSPSMELEDSRQQAATIISLISLIRKKDAATTETIEAWRSGFAPIFLLEKALLLTTELGDQK